MPQMNFDLEDGRDPVSFTLKHDDAERFMDFMEECHDAKEMAESFRRSMSESEDELERAQSQRDQLREALELITEAYTDLVNCGDCGHWNPEHDEEVVAARAALKATEEG